jgi:hypothetical protein
LLHHDGCRPIPEAELEVKQQERRMLKEAKKGLKRPRELYDATTAALSTAYSDDADLYDEVTMTWRPFDKLRKSLARHQGENVKVFGLDNIPEEFQHTCRGWDFKPGNKYHRERFLLYSGMKGQLLIFSDSLGNNKYSV